MVVGKINETKNSTSDMACLASQFPRLVGLAQASQVYRSIPELAKRNPGFTNNGNEVIFATIGNSSCAEGHFFEAVNAIERLQKCQQLFQFGMMDMEFLLQMIYK